jgi:3-phosphoshikimate 1-carboxyvinyltransferase
VPESVRFEPAGEGLRGTVSVPGDKSVSHRALLLGSVARSPVVVRGFLPSADTLVTLDAVRALGVRVEILSTTEVVIHGVGWEGLQEPDNVIDVGNAGTLLRLLPGLVAGRPFLTVLTGDASIRRRPMARVLEPLAAMGATVWGRRQGSLPPVGILGGPLRGISHRLTLASAQVKSCLLLAGLQAEGDTEVVEPTETRDHTERMIRAAGGTVEHLRMEDGAVSVKVRRLDAPSLDLVDVPGDFSSAAFLIVAALLVPDSNITIQGVGLNPTRTGLLGVLERMGARITVTMDASEGVEPRGEITVLSSDLIAVEIDAVEVPLLIDELPIWAIAAARARGTSRLRGAAELRVKESDRLAGVAALLRVLGVEVQEVPDGWDICGRPEGWDGGAVRTHGDHRLAMVGAVAGLASRDGVAVDRADCVSVSYPGFAATIAQLRTFGGSA